MKAAPKYRHLPVKLKLHLIIMGTVCTALLLAFAAVLVYDHVVLYETAEKDLGILTEIFATNAFPTTLRQPRQPRIALPLIKKERSADM